MSTIAENKKKACERWRRNAHKSQSHCFFFSRLGYESFFFLFYIPVTKSTKSAKSPANDYLIFSCVIESIYIHLILIMSNHHIRWLLRIKNN